MKILYVGPLMMINKLVPMSKRIFPNLKFDYITYERYTDAPDLLEHYDKKVDAVLFSGKSPYKICENQMNQSILMDYVPRHETTLYRVLLEITYLLKRDICRLSVDTYDKKMMQKLYKEIHVELREDSVFFAEQRYMDPNYKDYVVAFHRKNYYEHHVCCCITGLEEAYREMKSEGIPVVLAVPSEDVVVQSVRNLQIRYIAKKNSENQIVVVAIKLNVPSEYSLMKEDEYSYLSQRIKIMDRLYHFNHRIDGVLVEQSKSECMIFTTKKIIETETNQYKDFYLLDALREVSAVPVYIGIGYGKTANESKYNAYESMKKMERSRQNSVYIVFENGEVMGPLETGRGAKKQDSFDEKFYRAATETGLSVNTIYKIFGGIVKEEKADFTSRELAAICGVSVRTMDRIILKLCDAGYCEVISEKLMHKSGRPSRILRLHPLQIHNG